MLCIKDFVTAIFFIFHEERWSADVMSSLVRKSTERDGAGKTCQERCFEGPALLPYM